jgi:hypothetical protein
MIKYRSKVHVCKNSYITVIDIESDKEVARAFIDAEDAYRAAQYRWGLDKHSYLYTGIGCKMVGLHRFLLNLEVGDSKIVDHIDRNPLNNTKVNLRLCSGAQNQGNRKINKNNTSGYRGVSWEKTNQKWKACVYKNNKQIWLGLFDSKEKAAIAYNDAAIIYFGDFATLNFVKEI